MKIFRLLLKLIIIVSMFSCAGPSPRYSSYPDSIVKSKSSSSKSNKSKKSSSSSKNSKATKSKKHEMVGEASWYGPGFQGKLTANGEKFNMYNMTAAHKTLPFNTVVEVTDLSTGKKIKVRINDRGPYAKGRIIDLSKKAAQKLGILNKGHAKVQLRIIE